MITLIAVAVAAAQPAPPANDAHASMMGMSPEQHAAMMANCPCCPDKGMHDHDGHAPAQPQQHRGE